MADYSGYTIKRTHSLTPLTSVYEATAADGKPGRFALKVFHPPASTNVKRFYAIEGWLMAAERQQMSAKKDGAVVEVLAFGRCDEGAFAVMPWQERPLEPFIKILGPKGDTLRALAECLLNTVEAWEKQSGGPHGNIRPSNVFLNRTGSLVGMTAQLSDPAFFPGENVAALRQADFAAVGTMLATIVRRRLPGAWPIEEAPEWKALGPGGKGWLDFCNYLLNPSPKEGELTLVEARKRMSKVPKDANPVKTAGLTLAALFVLGLISLVAFARFGNPILMPDQVFRLAQAVKNPQIKPEVPRAWVDLCMAWDTWLIDLQSNANRLIRTQGLWEPGDPLRQQLENFVATSNQLRPEVLVTEAAREKRLGVLANSPPEAVLNELQLQSTIARISEAGRQLNQLRAGLENWPRWNQLRELQRVLDERNYTRIARELQLRIPPQRGSENYKGLDTARTLRFLRDLSLDSNGTLLVSSRWSEITQLKAAMETSGDRIQQEMPRIILARLADNSSIAGFADSLANPLDELRQRRQKFLDPQVVRERFLKESPMRAETSDVTEADFGRWEQELREYSLVPTADDVRLAPEIDASGTRMTQSKVDLEADAPAPEPGGLPTLSAADFEREFTTVTTSLKSLRDRPIVRRDLPDIAKETTQMAERFRTLEDRVKATIDLLKPEIWMAKAALAYGKFNETKQRWATWQQATLTGLTPEVLAGVANRPRFRQLRANERQVKQWIDGVEGETGFGALTVPALAAASADTAAELVRLEAVRREQAVAAVANAVEWRDALPQVSWDAATAPMRAPLEAHRQWLGRLVDFATYLDQLGERLLAGSGWGEGVSELRGLLQGFPGVDDLTGRPGEWYAESRQLELLAGTTDRDGLTAAAQSGGLSRKLMAWRALGTLAGWPAGSADFDLDTGVITVMREIVGRDVKDESRRGSLLEEMVQQTKLRFNRAARTASRAETEMTAMFERMQAAGLTETDLDKPVAYNLALWRLKRDDWNETNLDRLGKRRDLFVRSVRAIPGIAAPDTEVEKLLTTLEEIELKDDPNRPPTPSPRMAGWTEVPSNEGLNLTATWTKGAKKVQIEYAVVQPTDGTPPFFLATRPVAVGEFVTLINAKTKEAEAVYNELPKWAQGVTTLDKPYNEPVSWQPRSSGWGVDINPSWILMPNPQVKPLLENATDPAMVKAVTENPTARTPLNQVPPDAAKIFAEQVLGARLPKPAEWRAATTLFDRPAGGFFRGLSFQNLWRFLEQYREGGVPVPWRPNEGIYLPAAQGTGGAKRMYVDDGAVGDQDQGRLWLAPVDEGPKTGGSFINLFGNVWTLLCEPSADPAKKPVYYVAGGSALSPPGVDIKEPQKVEAVGRIGASVVREGFADVGIRPAFDAPPGFKERYKLFVLVRDQRYLTL